MISIQLYNQVKALNLQGICLRKKNQSHLLSFKEEEEDLGNLIEKYLLMILSWEKELIEKKRKSRKYAKGEKNLNKIKILRFKIAN